jgi:hypothetical protein
LPGLADPTDLSGVVGEPKVADPDLGRLHAGESEPQHQLVPHADLAVAPASGEELSERLVVGEPAGRVLGLHLGVEAGDSTKGLVRSVSTSTMAGSASPWRTHHRRNVVTRDNRFRTVLLATGSGIPAHRRRTSASVS